MTLKSITADTAALARAIRRHALVMTRRAKASHIGSCLSMADLLAVLYGRVMRLDAMRHDDPARDRLLISKGHAAAAVYAALAESGFFPRERLDGYSTNESLLCGHVSHKVPGVELSTGALGHGLPVAAGVAVAGERCRRPFRVFALLSDGELDEGSNWEAMLFAGHHRLGNLTLIVDANKIQSFGSVVDVLDLEDIAAKLRTLKWQVTDVDGHDHGALEKAMQPAPAGAAQNA